MKKISDCYELVGNFVDCNFCFYGSNGLLIELKTRQSCNHLGIDCGKNEVIYFQEDDKISYISSDFSKYIRRKKW